MYGSGVQIHRLYSHRVEVIFVTINLHLLHFYYFLLFSTYFQFLYQFTCTLPFYLFFSSISLSCFVFFFLQFLQTSEHSEHSVLHFTSIWTHHQMTLTTKLPMNLQMDLRHCQMLIHYQLHYSKEILVLSMAEQA